MSLKNSFIFKAAVGFSLGVLMSILISMGYLVQEGNNSLYQIALAGRERALTSILLELLSGGLIGMAGYAGSVVYEIERWGTLRCMTVHFTSTMLVYIMLGFLNGWLTPELSVANLVQVGITVSIFVVIWLIQYFLYKKEVADLNRSVALLKNGEQM